MNALDRAFIRAYAKDRSATVGERAEAVTAAQRQPPAVGVVSQMLPADSLSGGSRHLRVDRPVSPDCVFLAPHLAMPLVQHCESYDAASIGTEPIAAVWVVPPEDSPAKEASLDEELDPPAAAETPVASWRAVWEVDAFTWPEAVLELERRSREQLAQTGDALAVAVQDGLRVVMVTSAAGQEGRTTVTLALTRAAVAAGSRVALIDLDSQHPDLARQLGIETPCDWPEILSAGQPSCEAAVASTADGVTLFPRVAPSQQLAAPLEAGLLVTLLQDLGRRFDLILIDAPEVEHLSATMLLSDGSAAVDMAVLVRDVQRTTRDGCLSAAEDLRRAGVRAVGIIENFSSAREPTDASCGEPAAGSPTHVGGER